MSPSYNHSYLAYRIGHLIDTKAQYNIHIELTLDIGGIDFIPDISIYPRKNMDFLHDQVKTSEMPIMVTEILSPRQSVNEITEKFEIYLKSGIQSCWLIIPPTKTVVVFNDINQPFSYSSHSSGGELVDKMMNIQLSVKKIFQ